jgi:hypothetical protein
MPAVHQRLADIYVSQVHAAKSLVDLGPELLRGDGDMRV